MLPSAARLPPAVGTTMILAPSPPALLMKVSKIPVPTFEPPPWITSVPLAGPYSGVCAQRVPAESVVTRLRAYFIKRRIPLCSLPALPADGVIVRGHGAGGCRDAEVDERERAVDLAAGMSAGDEVLDAEQAALNAELDQRTLAPKVSVRAGQRPVELRLAPGRF